MQITATVATPLGSMLLAADSLGITGLWFEGQRHFGRTLRGERQLGELPVMDAARRWLDAYFRGQSPEASSVPLHLLGTPFQLEVWQLLREIPYGQTTTYGALARALARRRGLERMCAQAVGGAVARNPVALLVPCHRVLGADGSLTGYAGGMERKAWLLRMEGGAPPLTPPSR